MFSNKSLRTALMVLFALCGQISGAHAQDQSAVTDPKPLVLLIGLDGFKPAYLSAETTPHLLALAQQGVQAKGLVSSFPTLTFPNHLTLVTGQTPDHHGIVNNNMLDPGTPQRFSLGSREAVENPFWWQAARPIWVTAQQQGKVASTLFWPGSETSIQGVRPNDWLPYEHSMTHETRLATLLSWLSRPQAQRPDLATLYLSDVDSAGHVAGPDSQAVKEATAKVDHTLGQLMAQLNQKGLLAQTTWVVVSDHGIALTPPSQVISVQSLLSAFPAARWEWLGATSGVRLNGESQEAVLKALATVQHVSCWPKGNMPKRFKFGTHPRIPDIVCLSEAGYSVADNPAQKGPLGQHGYDPEHPDMHGLLIVSGQGIPQRQLGLVSNLEIHGLLSKLLGIVAPADDGEGTLVPQIFHP
jgi:ectonucleotide pyrophosphatase/phosphodiesterase family member 5